MPDPDPALERQARRRASAAVALFVLGEPAPALAVFRSAAGDPAARSHLIEWAGVAGDPPAALVRQFRIEVDPAGRRALVLALADCPPGPEWAADREALAAELLDLYRTSPDPGLHAAVGWVLRTRWEKAAEVARADAELAAVKPTGRAGRNWYVGPNGHTFAVVPGPVAFTQGSPPGEPGRHDGERPHARRIGRTFAVATTEVTNDQYRRFRPDHGWDPQVNPGPAADVSWFDCAAYCNWLSERAGVPRDEWCYEPRADGRYDSGMRIKADHLALAGHRLPTEAEWKYACRAGAATARFFGREDELLHRCARYRKSAGGRAWPVAGLRPNDRGLFDTQGNVLEWIEDAQADYPAGAGDDGERPAHATVTGDVPRRVRGGSFADPSAYVRSAHRTAERAHDRFPTLGFRVARTVPPPPAGGR